MTTILFVYIKSNFKESDVVKHSSSRIFPTVFHYECWLRGSTSMSVLYLLYGFTHLGARQGRGALEVPYTSIGSCNTIKLLEHIFDD